MKKKLTFIIFTFFFFICYSQTIPEELIGIWEGSDRYVFFEENSLDSQDFQPQLVVVYKEYYGWYLDRAAENKSYKDTYPRARNLATPKDSVQILFDFQDFSEDVPSKNLFQLVLHFNNHVDYIPVFINDNNLYLDFYVQNKNVPDFYGQVNKSLRIGVTDSITENNIYGLYFSEQGIFYVRYWLSDMEYSDENVMLNYNNQTYFVPKNIFSGNYNFSCVVGRSKRVRNVETPILELPKQSIYSSDGSILTMEKPYLTKISDKKTFQELVKIVNEQNSKRKLDPNPLFPVTTHYDLLFELLNN